MPTEPPDTRDGLPFSAVVVIGALAVFGAIAMAQWTLNRLFGLVRFGLVLLVIVGVAGWVVSAKSSR